MIDNQLTFTDHIASGKSSRTSGSSPHGQAHVISRLVYCPTLHWLVCQAVRTVKLQANDSNWSSACGLQPIQACLILILLQWLPVATSRRLVHAPDPWCLLSGQPPDLHPPTSFWLKGHTTRTFCVQGALNPNPSSAVLLINYTTQQYSVCRILQNFQKNTRDPRLNSPITLLTCWMSYNRFMCLNLSVSFFFYNKGCCSEIETEKENKHAGTLYCTIYACVSKAVFLWDNMCVILSYLILTLLGTPWA